MPVADFTKARNEAEKYDKLLLDNLVNMHADMCTALDLTKGTCPEEEPEKNALMQYERTLAASIQRLKELSPYFN
tara:strand:+ start:401 stop:625 length:225 start_codon:yes stop_codon:yes gene_type:complete